MSVKTCAEPGCPELTTTIYCAQHHQDRRRKADQRRQTTRSNYGTPRWRRVRRAYLRDHPLCECGCGRIAGVVHHLDGEGLHGPRAFDPGNLEALAKACHDRLTARETPGGWNAR